MIGAVGVRCGRDVESLPLLAGLHDTVEAQLRQAVTAARADGFSWQHIGNTLGISKQAAQQRFSRS